MLNDLQVLERLIEETRGPCSPGIPAVVFQKSLVELQFHCTTPATMKRLREVQVASRNLKNKDIEFLIASIIPRYEMELKGGERLTDLQRRNRLIKLNKT